MRGIEAALNVLSSVNRKSPDQNRKSGKFAIEMLRKLAAQENMKSTDISLASSLIYISMRRRELWQKIAADYLVKSNPEANFAKLPGFVRDCVVMGTGGLLELRRFSGGVLVNGILENLRARNFGKFTALVNAILHKVGELGAQKLEAIKNSSRIEERAMWAGIPVWSLPAWLKTWDRVELNQICDYMIQQPASTLRISPNLDQSEVMELVAKFEKFGAEISKLSGAIHLRETVNPTELDGFNEGKFTVQSESSILAASIINKFANLGRKNFGHILDMCSGRGVKAGQILQECESSELECWEISENRQKSALNELKRLGVVERAIFKTGNALELSPENQPDFVMLDAPCTGSGTWNRKPESKWNLSWENLDKSVYTQKKLLAHAVNLCKSGGYVLYITCSLLKQENENVIAEILAKNPGCIDVTSFLNWKTRPFRKGKPWGVYIMPETPWLDGFYCALILRK